jgi:hypothetical protein
MKARKTPAAIKRSRKEKVAHIRFSPEEFSAVEAAAGQAGFTVSAFVRSLSLEGAGLQPIFTEVDRAILALLADGMRTIGVNLNHIVRSINSDRSVAVSDVAAAVVDARAVATVVAVELADMTKRAAVARRSKAD